ncbi:hypothetical protein PAU_02166 [Photorhabdus asymbiotica]|uniref:Uncharacterized protein n=1 Tax=Photorhabdus asymbiotica subsp. asymbiotica (strain ATCC 43949 / 3105-77) TaxID=553480 RepID=C7BK18_PHOAA|nr:hypothetical protein PAU_02166 [Photorhabdus asymbiotica]
MQDKRIVLQEDRVFNRTNYDAKIISSEKPTLEINSQIFILYGFQDASRRQGSESPGA